MKNYRITYSFDREEIFTFITEAVNVYNAVCNTRSYVEKEHGFLTFNDVVGLGILEIE